MIKELLEVFTKYEVIEYDTRAKYDGYHMLFSNTETGESLQIDTRKDNSLTVQTRTYVTNKDDDKRIISRDSIKTHNSYRIKNGELNVDVIDDIFDTIN